MKLIFHGEVNLVLVNNKVISRSET